MTSRLALAVYRAPEEVPNCTPVAVVVPALKTILVTCKLEHCERRGQICDPEELTCCPTSVVKLGRFSTGVRYAVADDERWSESCGLIVCITVN